MKYSATVAAAAILMAALIGNTALGADVSETEPSASTAPSAPVAPTSPLTDLLTASGLTTTGYVAASYYHSNGNSTFHQFDTQHDTFQLDQAAFTLAYQPKQGFGAVVNVAAGEDMKILNAAEGSNSNSFDVIQGFVQYAGGPFTVIAGKYVTLVGAEVIAPTGNTNFSRGLLFYAEPLTHTGVRATYAVNDTLNVIVGVNNGWNTVSTSYGSKTGEVGIAYTPNKMFALAAQALVGKVPGYNADKAIVDVVGTYNVTDALSLVLSIDWGKQQQSNDLPNQEWNGVAAYVNYAITDQWRVSVRGDYLNDKDGLATLTGTPQKLKSGTLTFGYDPVKSFELRIEGRYDKSNHATFVRPVTDGDSEFANNQTGFALQGVYKF